MNIRVVGASSLAGRGLLRPWLAPALSAGGDAGDAECIDLAGIPPVPWRRRSGGRDRPDRAGHHPHSAVAVSARRRRVDGGDGRLPPCFTSFAVKRFGDDDGVPVGRAHFCRVYALEGEADRAADRCVDALSAPTDRGLAAIMGRVCWRHAIRPAHPPAPAPHTATAWSTGSRAPRGCPTPT